MAGERNGRPRKPSLARVMLGLKDFQRDTVRYVVHRMFDAEHCSHRFLVADEVGLGKTMVARGVIAATIERLWKAVDRIDVLYICSNSDIARQNLERLRFPEAGSAQLASRITLLPATLKDLKGRKLNLVSFTPGTSFDLRSSAGLAEERVLLYFLLCDAGWLHPGEAARKMMQGMSGREAFRNRIRGYDRQGIDEGLRHAFVQALNAQSLRSARAHAGESGTSETLRERFQEQYEQFKGTRRDRAELPEELRAANNRLIGELRMLLAETCLEALEPDLIVLDEFQRFKHLLDEADTPLSRLAHRLFNYQDATSKVRVLLLSATPYKMYTVAHDQEGDDHYADFLRTIRFLQNDLPATERFEQVLSEYRRAVMNAAHGGVERLVELKEKLQDMLRAVMVRTERLAASHDRNGMLRETKTMRVDVTPGDVRSYAGMQRVAREVGAEDTIEFWKSAPYLLNFMEGYALKRLFEEMPPGSPQRARVATALAAAPESLLSWDAVARYERIDPGNARLRALVAATLDLGAWRLAWLPPSMPYYASAGPFAEPGVEGLTKYIIFSSWRIVPKVVAAFLSYEGERRMMAERSEPIANTPEARRKLQRPLQFRRDDLQTGMMTFALMYPAMVLAQECDPLDVAREAAPHVPVAGEPESLLSLDALFARVRVRVEQLLRPLVETMRGDGAADRDTSAEEDRRWYWAAPLLMDRAAFGSAVDTWLAGEGAADRWSGDAAGADVQHHEPVPDDGVADEDAPAHRAEGGHAHEGTVWKEHIAEARRIVGEEVRLGRPPADLVDVLTLIAVGAPGVAALRALVRLAQPHAPHSRPDSDTSSLHESRSTSERIRTAAARVAWRFRSLFNTPEIVAVVRAGEGVSSYWRRVLGYCVDGNLQSVLDEYAHNLEGVCGLVDHPAEERAEKIAASIASALELRTAGVHTDEIVVEGHDVRLIPHRRMRMHFALRFGDERGEREESGARKKNVQEAFNSPFWPFVLASTSVGQEGLDFHPYCHAVVHWNLPSNPVDLEQREGRVHRFKGHAVRRNVADTYRGAVVAPGNHLADPWTELFALAARERDPNASDLIPYWVYPGRAAIERHVPALPHSRDAARLEQLRTTLTLYRMVFGQPRQDDLLAYLMDRVPADQREKLLDALRIDLTPHATAQWECEREGGDIDDEYVIDAEEISGAPSNGSGDVQEGADSAERSRDVVGATVPIDELSTENIVCAIRGVFAHVDAIPTPDVPAAVARALGYRRTGPRIYDAVRSAMNAAVRRGVILLDNGAYRIDCRAITDYPDDLRERYFYAAIGRGWVDRDESVRLAARYLGFRRTGETITAEFERIIRRGLRRGELERDGDLIRRVV